MNQLIKLLKESLQEMRLCREKDGAGPYDPTLKTRIESELVKWKCVDCDKYRTLPGVTRCTSCIYKRIKLDLTEFSHEEI